VEQALAIMAEAYGKLGQNELKQHVLMVMKANYPDNEMLKQD
jgi:outer membrane protein assembly factor BamD